MYSFIFEIVINLGKSLKSQVRHEISQEICFSLLTKRGTFFVFFACIIKLAQHLYFRCDMLICTPTYPCGKLRKQSDKQYKWMFEWQLSP